MSEKQQILEFVSYKRDYAALWTIYEVMPGGKTDTYEFKPGFFQDRNGKWWLITRDLYNTNEQLDKSLAKTDFYMAEEHVIYLNGL